MRPRINNAKKFPSDAVLLVRGSHFENCSPGACFSEWSEALLLLPVQNWGHWLKMQIPGLQAY